MITETFHSSGIPPMPAAPQSPVMVWNKKVLIATPWQKQVHPVTSFCVTQLSDKRRTASSLAYGDAFVAHSRNTCVDEFLKTSLDYILMVDDDMVLPFGNAAAYRLYSDWDWYPDPFAGFHTVDRLMSHNKSVVGVLYFGRNKNGLPVFAANHDAIEFARKAPHDRLFQTDWVGTGAILIHRQVFLDIEKKFPVLARDTSGKYGQWFTSSEHGLLDGVKHIYSEISKGAMDGVKCMRVYEMLEGLLNKTKRSSSLGMGEDVIFCKRAREAGHDVFVDLGLVAGHVGYTVFGPRNTFPKK